MARIQHSVQINRQPAEVFEITNDIDNWRILFDEYNQSEVLSRQDAGRFTKLVFRLTNKEGQTWTSWRILDHQDLIAIAQRHDPLFPFVYMHLTWTYEPVDGGTLMTWTQDFEVDPAFEVPEHVAAERMEQHGKHNQQRIKGLIESGAAALPLERSAT